MPIARIIRSHQRDGLAAVFRTGRTTDTMHIILRIVRYVVVDHERHVGHVYTARDDIRSHQYVDLAVAKIQHHLVAFLLLQVAMHRSGVDTERTQGTGQFLDALLLAGKDNDFLEVTSLQRQLHEARFLGFK